MKEEIKDYETFERNKQKTSYSFMSYDPWVTRHGMGGEPCDLSTRGLIQMLFVLWIFFYISKQLFKKKHKDLFRFIKKIT